jgi:hypothetical protein
VGVKMWRFLKCMTLFILLISGCQSNSIEEVVKEQDINNKENVSKQNNKNSIKEVVNKHGHIQNLDALNTFVENVKDQNKSVINYVRYGIEGQRGVMTLTFNGENVNVFHEVDGNFIEEYNCKDVIIDTKEDDKRYILIQCSGDFEGDFELLSISTKHFN